MAAGKRLLVSPKTACVPSYSPKMKPGKDANLENWSLRGSRLGREGSRTAAALWDHEKQVPAKKPKAQWLDGWADAKRDLHHRQTK